MQIVTIASPSSSQGRGAIRASNSWRKRTAISKVGGLLIRIYFMQHSESPPPLQQDVVVSADSPPPSSPPNPAIAPSQTFPSHLHIIKPAKTECESNPQASNTNSNPRFLILSQHQFRRDRQLRGAAELVRQRGRSRRQAGGGAALAASYLELMGGL
jgi:hypothetical protein